MPRSNNDFYFYFFDPSIQPTMDFDTTTTQEPPPPIDFYFPVINPQQNRRSPSNGRAVHKQTTPIGDFIEPSTTKTKIDPSTTISCAIAPHQPITAIEPQKTTTNAAYEPHPSRWTPNPKHRSDKLVSTTDPFIQQSSGASHRYQTTLQRGRNKRKKHRRTTQFFKSITKPTTADGFRDTSTTTTPHPDDFYFFIFTRQQIRQSPTNDRANTSQAATKQNKAAATICRSENTSDDNKHED